MTRIALAFAATNAILAGEARAHIPHLNASCPTEIEIHDDKGASNSMNGHEAELAIYIRNAHDAR